MVIMMLILMRRVKGELPFTEEAYAAWKRGQALLAVAIVGCIALFVGSLGVIGNDLVGPGFALMAAAVALPIVVGIKFARGRGVTCQKIADGRIELKVPSEEAAMEITSHLTSGARRGSSAAGGAPPPPAPRGRRNPPPPAPRGV